MGSVRYISDGSFSVADVRRTLEAEGVLLQEASGNVRFVPDDPGFPTTVFRQDGQIELHPDTTDALRLDEYVERLSAWLGVSLQRVPD